MAFLPDKANSPLIIDPDRVLPPPIASESLKPVRGWHAQIIEPSGIVEKTQFAKCASLNVRRQPATGVARPDGCGLTVAKADDHERFITQNVMSYKSRRPVRETAAAGAAPAGAVRSRA